MTLAFGGDEIARTYFGLPHPRQGKVRLLSQRQAKFNAVNELTALFQIWFAG